VDDPVSELLTNEKNFGWLDVWKLNAEGMGSVWPMTFATY
jgi:hypothetical protein